MNELRVNYYEVAEKYLTAIMEEHRQPTLSDKEYIELVTAAIEHAETEDEKLALQNLVAINGRLEA